MIWFVFCRSSQDAEAHLAQLSDALTGLREQLIGQCNTLAELCSGEAELRRLLADKAGLADVQTALQASHAPALVPVSALPLSSHLMLKLIH